MELDSDSDLQAYINELTQKAHFLKWEEDVISTDGISTPSKISSDFSTKANKKDVHKISKIGTKSDHKIRFLEEKYLKKSRKPILDEGSSSLSLDYSKTNESDVAENVSKQDSHPGSDSNESYDESEIKFVINDASDLISVQNDSNLYKEENIIDKTIVLRPQPSFSVFKNKFDENSTKNVTKISHQNKPTEIISPSDSVVEEIPEELSDRYKTIESPIKHRSSDVTHASFHASNHQKYDKGKESTESYEQKTDKAKEDERKSENRRKKKRKEESAYQLNEESRKSKDKTKTSNKSDKLESKKRKDKRKHKNDSFSTSISSSSSLLLSSSSSSSSSSTTSYTKRRIKKKKSKGKKKKMTELIMKILMKKFPLLLNEPIRYRQEYRFTDPPTRNIFVESDSTDWHVTNSRIDDALRQSIDLTRQFLETHRQFVEMHCRYNDSKYKYTVLNDSTAV